MCVPSCKIAVEPCGLADIILLTLTPNKWSTMCAWNHDLYFSFISWAISEALHAMFPVEHACPQVISGYEVLVDKLSVSFLWLCSDC